MSSADEQRPERVQQQGGSGTAPLPVVGESKAMRRARKQDGTSSKPLKGRRLQELLAPHRNNSGKIVRMTPGKVPWWTRAGFPHRVEFIPELDWSILERTRAQRLLTVAEAAQVAHRGLRATHALIARGTIPALRVRGASGSSYQYRLAIETAEWLGAHPNARIGINRVVTDRYYRREAIENLASSILGG